MGLTPTKETVSTLEDRSWLGSADGTDATESKTLDGASARGTFAAGTFIPSGVVLAYDTTSHKAVLYDGGGTGDEAVAKGFLFSGQLVPATGDLHVAVLKRGAIREANLPTNHGLDSAAKTDLSLFDFR